MLTSMPAEQIEAAPASSEQLARVHNPALVKALEAACVDGPGIIDHAPTFITTTSYEDALLAAGGVIACTQAVLRGEAANAFAIVRPPGHHAEPERAMGFCIFNNAAVAAQDALQSGLERVMVIDYDAHHGNGTQAAFLNEPRAGFLSTHQWGIYPGSGWYKDAPHAKGRIVNVPLEADSGDEAYARVTDEVIRPFVRNFRSQLILVSAGFDAHWNDPITSLGLSTRGYYEMSRRLVELAGETCGGKIIFVLEGGYDPSNVANGAAAVFDALAGSELRHDPRDSCPYADVDPAQRIHEILSWHALAS